ncbi:MAG: hypothetical protein IJG37_05065 [Synergistaceae bacterium]|nr:hypothetical protein [Synergistaceae bacterium]MBQ4430330.1 hypothetical protein [Synergistaceae bacterium]MBQ7168927.1 hypothetical protein [Synergistaceae bacterium]
MSNEELIAELRRDNAEMRSRITSLEAKVETANFEIKGLHKRIAFERNLMMMGFFFIFLLILIVSVRIILDLMECAIGARDSIRNTEECLSRKIQELSRNRHETTGGA